MIELGGRYSLPLLPPELARRLKDKAEWPTDLQSEYDRCRKDFTKSKAEFLAWARKDRDSRMNRTAKAILGVIIECLNFETGRCDPSHQYIADELGVSVSTVGRSVPRIVAAGWLAVTRRGKTKTNLYQFAVSKDKVSRLLEYVDNLREQRQAARDRRDSFCDPAKMTGHRGSDPAFVRSHDPAKMTAHDPAKMTGKHLNRTSEGEHLNKCSCSEGSKESPSGAEERFEPFPIPCSEGEAEQMLEAICDGRAISAERKTRFMDALQSGKLTPHFVESLMGPKREDAA